MCHSSKTLLDFHLSCATPGFGEITFSYAYDVLGVTLIIRKWQVLFQPSPDHPQGWTQPDITVGDQCLSSVDPFTYLGSCLSCKADLDVETLAHLKSAGAAFGNLREREFDNRNIYISTNVKVHKTITLPTLLYGSEAQTTYSCHLKNHERYHQSCLHHILNIKWQDRRTNSSVLEEANVTIIESCIIKNRLCWAGHLVCMPLSGLLRKFLYSKLTNGRCNQRGGNENALRIALNTISNSAVSNSWSGSN